MCYIVLHCVIEGATVVEYLKYVQSCSDMSRWFLNWYEVEVTHGIPLGLEPDSSEDVMPSQKAVDNYQI